MHLVGFIRIYHDARSPERQNFIDYTLLYYFINTIYSIANSCPEYIYLLFIYLSYVYKTVFFPVGSAVTVMVTTRRDGFHAVHFGSYY